MTINEYLVSQRAINIPLAATFMDTVMERYQTLTPEFAWLLTQLKTYLLRGGKWHRPALALLAYHIVGGVDETTVRPSLLALEILHRYILIHDDLVDRDLRRHDGPTLEQIYKDKFSSVYPGQKDEMYSKGMAIVAGDVVNSLAYELLIDTSRISPEVVVAATRAFNQLMMETVAGWQLQTEQNFTALEAITEDAVIAGMTMVSAQYSVVWPLRIGQVFAGKLTSDSWDTRLESYGLNAGLAFQITDDVLGMFGTPEITGKPVGHDYREGKKTLVLLSAYKRASTSEQAFIKSTLGLDVTESDIHRVRQIMESTGALADAKEKADYYAQQAQHALQTIPSEYQENMMLLHELADLFAHRTH